MITSILTSVKKMLGIAAEDDAFDFDVILYINGAFARLNELGVGPEGGFMIEDATPTWDAFLGTDPRLNSVKQYVALHCKMLFDPPGTQYLVEALTKQIEKLEWCINVVREHTIWTDPIVVEIDDEGVIDGGAP